MTKRLLVVDAYSREGRKRLAAAGATEAGELYRRMLVRLVPGVHLDIITADTPDPLADAAPLSSYQGVVWTGSSLTVYHDEPIVRRQIELVRATFQAGVPAFGSCYAAQIAVVAAGGQCAANPKGREFGLARKITLTEAGRSHPMFVGKPAAFDAFTCHLDEITHLPANSSVLATNAFTQIQAVEVNAGKSSFWAIQYHPEYDTHEIARIAIARAQSLIAQGLFESMESIMRYANDFEAMDDPTNTHLAFTYGVDSDVLSFDARTLEVQNWLAQVAFAQS